VLTTANTAGSKGLNYEKYCRRNIWETFRRLIAVHLRSAVNLLIAFYDIHGRKKEVLFFVLLHTPHEDIVIRKLRVVLAKKFLQ
jgi:uncharacterized protein YehS (DUF1456 family)